MEALEHLPLSRHRLLFKKQQETDPAAGVAVRDKETQEEEEEKLYCAQCGRLITKGIWRISVNGGHEHTFFNPAGVIFELFCFKEAPGVFPRGGPSGEFTWFKGATWQVVHCSGCSVHIGWKFSAAGEPRVFFALIQSKLANKKPEGT